LPWPIETVFKAEINRTFSIDVDGAAVQQTARRTARPVDNISLMLTGDENIVDIDFAVLWQISDANDFLFNVRDPEQSIKEVSISAMREVVGRSKFNDVITENRRDLALEVRDLTQNTLNQYAAGIRIIEVQLKKSDPPEQVLDDFKDVQRARADRDRFKNEAEKYANQIIPEARGEAARILQSAAAYKEETVAQASGEAERFISIYEQYARAPDVTRRRLFLETMEEVFGQTNKVIIDDDQIGGQGGIVPYLPLNELQKRRPSTGALQSAPTQ
ncbi:MAG: FtsH protease activity modulator HflK, partial [Pseudomonadota bacterium]